MNTTTRMIARAAGTALIAAAAVLLTPTASATTIVRMTVEEMTLRATDVLAGVVTRVESIWTDDRQQILTYVTIATTDTLKGGLQGEVTFVQLGGQVDDHLMLVVGSAEFLPNQEVMVFLKQMPSAKRLAVNTDRWLLGLSQGAWTLVQDRQGREVAVSQLAPGCAIERPGASTPLQMETQALKQRVRAVVADARAANAAVVPMPPTDAAPSAASPARKEGN